MSSPVGSYISNSTFIHKLDPRLKLSVSIIYITLTFATDYFITLGILLIPIMIGYIIATKSFVPVLKLLKLPLFLGILIFFINIYTMPLPNELWPSNPIHHVWLYLGTIGENKYAITYEVFATTLGIVLRVYVMIIATSLFVITTKPILLTKAIEDLLFPLKFLFVPTHIIAMIISISLRFIPTLLDEAKRIMKAQASRGIDFKNGKLKDKAKSFTTLIIPLFVTSFAKAEDLANAMETRGYDPYQKRTRYRHLIFKWQDYVITLFVIGLIIFVATSIHVDFLPRWYTIAHYIF
ncbi:energy-coupling factor transporter transmembrane protein EcfT [Mycoplasma sp. Mirounga ES2805-ORL]|uniref:energy-coupling factor transporter transmembrane component T family protein n=1 Tax=Mycoplasma sp. Mirounga ES2805-ORL TaxID=754514 RepID=UPI00197C2104|nr:energy-coupling factor transporter transmembrane component T [Mycoplasma sp. Mirounga ES2805-ORL]QSF13720.1 energy-coupling factor transporter transmembrane protein EcfT [Mycoplasma sp. Mirounga ES2805-ORL]